MHPSKVSMVSQPCTGKRLGTCHGPTWSSTVQRSDSVLWHVHWFAFFSCLFFSFQLGWTLVIDPETDRSCCNSILRLWEDREILKQRAIHRNQQSSCPELLHRLECSAVPKLPIPDYPIWDSGLQRFQIQELRQCLGLGWGLLPKYRGDLRSRYGHFAESHVLMVNEQRFMTSGQPTRMVDEGKTSSTKPVESE